MNDQTLDALLEAAVPVRDVDVEHVDLAGIDHEIREAIMSTPVLDSIDSSSPTTEEHQQNHQKWQKPRMLRRAVAATAAAAVVAGAVFVGLPGGTESSQAWAAEVVEVAEASPRLLVSHNGWTVSRADEFGVGTGEMTFSDGTNTLHLHWRPASEHNAYLTDRAQSADQVHDVRVNGKNAQQFRYADSDDYTTLWISGSSSVEARGVFVDSADYRSVVQSLEVVEVDEWLTAMPPLVVDPLTRASAIDDMLTDIPTPDSFDRSAIDTSNGVTDRYQLGAHVTGTVACQWLNQYTVATAANDVASRDEAVAAMQTSRNWTVLKDMQTEGEWPSTIWHYADVLESGETDALGRGPADTYHQSLACDRFVSPVTP